MATRATLRRRPVLVTSATTPDPDSGVNEPIQAYKDMEEGWHIVRSLWGGTLTMREAGQTFLPAEHNESAKAYEIRLQRTFLFNAFRRTVKQLSGKPFAVPVKLSEDVSPEIEEWCENIDNNGRTLHAFCKDWFEDAMQVGLSHCLVDFPPELRDEAGNARRLSLAEERELNRRPYWTMIRAEQLIGWRTIKVGGRQVLTQIRVRENALEPDGRWGEVEVERVRVIERDHWEVWQKSIDGTTWFKTKAEGVNTLGEIGLVTLYCSKTGMLTGEPPLMDLAQLNLAHWRSSSDQEHILHVARVPILFGKNLAARAAPDGAVQGQNQIEIGPNRMIQGPENSDLKYVEHSGGAIGSGRQALLDLEDRMTVMGLELQVRRPSVTATQEIIDTAESESELHAMVAAMKLAVDNALTLSGQWVGIAPEQTGEVTFFTDFGISQRQNAEIDQLLKMRQAGEISRETFYGELMRRGFLESGFDPEAEMALLETEAPTLTGTPLPLAPPQPGGPTPPPPSGTANEGGAGAGAGA